MKNPRKMAVLGWTVLVLIPFAPVLLGADDSVVMQSDHTFTQSLSKGDVKNAEVLMKSDFAWTDSNGDTHSKSEALKSGALSSEIASESEVKSHLYGDLGAVTGTHQNAWFVRIWVKEPSNWLLFLALDTPMSSEGRATSLTGDCENPCRLVPYTPKTSAEKAVLAEWQKTKVDEWHPNASDWAIHIGDEFLLIIPGSIRNKAERVAIAKKREADGTSDPGAPILSMRMYDLGQAVVMVSNHFPYQGGKPYYNVRIFVSRENHWPLVYSQQTTIQSGREYPPVTSKKE